MSNVSIVSVRLPTGDTPICGVTLEPYVLVKRGEQTITTDDIPDEGSAEGLYQLRCRWSRSILIRGGAVCSVHPDREATLQCAICLKLRAPQHLSYHCSPECFKSNWPLHRESHHRSFLNGGLENGEKASFCNTVHMSNGEAWVEVARGRNYTPQSEDVGYTLKFECSIIDKSQPFIDYGRGVPVYTSRVRPAPTPPIRNLIPLVNTHNLQSTKFSILSYNLLADIYAQMMMESGCPPWALSWQYRKQNLLKELLNYKADILCLQEVQSDHFADFLAPELHKQGYESVYKKKTGMDSYVGGGYAIDGCATFYKKDKFTLVKKYEVEFNKAARSLADSIQDAGRRQAALSRLMKDNVALITVLDVIDPLQQSMDGTNRSRAMICVGNTHIHANPELKDVKLWQVVTLLKGLEKIAKSADIPMVVAGDFNSIPGSTPHDLLVSGRVDMSTLDNNMDPLGILREQKDKLEHDLKLKSAYSAFFQPGNQDPKSLRQRQRLCPTTQEPLFTNLGRHFKGTLDYILYTHMYVTPVSLLELPLEKDLVEKQEEVLPNPTWSSDHIALMAEFQYCRPPYIRNRNRIMNDS